MDNGMVFAAVVLLVPFVLIGLYSFMFYASSGKIPPAWRAVLDGCACGFLLHQVACLVLDHLFHLPRFGDKGDLHTPTMILSMLAAASMNFWAWKRGRKEIASLPALETTG